jgi:hypothetical protein
MFLEESMLKELYSRARVTETETEGLHKPRFDQKQTSQLWMNDPA